MQFKRTLILVFVIVSALAVWDATRLGVDGFPRGGENNFVRFGGDRVPAREPDFEEEQTLKAQTGVRRVIVDGFAGKLEVTRSATDELTASYSVAIWSEDRGDRARETAVDLSRQLDVGWAREGDQARLTVELPRSLPAGIAAIRVSARLAVPDGVELDLRHTGDAHVEGISGVVHLEHEQGEVVVRQVEGSLEMDSSWTSVSVDDVRGPVQVEVRGGDLRVRDVTGDVDAGVQMGALYLRDVEGNVNLSVAQGAGQVEDVRGDVRVSGSFGGMTVDQVTGDVEAQQRFGSLKVTGVTRAVDVSVQFSELDLVLQGPGGWTVDAVAESGTLETDLNLQWEQLEGRTTLSGVIGDGAHDLKIRVNRASARISQR